MTGTVVIEGDDAFDIVLTAAASSDAVTAVTLADLQMYGWWAEGTNGVHIKDESGAAVKAEYTVVLENLRMSDHYGGVRVDKAVDSGRTGNIVIRNSKMDRRSGPGAGVYLNACDMVEPFHEVVLTVSNSSIHQQGHRPGTGVHNDCGYLKVIGSAIVGGHDGVSASGGRIGKGSSAGVAAPTKTEIINATINGGGGVGVSVWKDSSSVKPELLIVNSTITDNNARGEFVVGGIRTMWKGAGQHDGERFDVEIFNSVVAGNTGMQCELADSLVGEAESGNASSDDSCGFGLVRSGFGLGELGQWFDGKKGWELRTRAVNRHSPLIDAVTGPHCPHEKAPTDARGVSRPQGSACDIGAYAAEYAELEGRMWGRDRYGTAAAMSRETFAPRAGAVYLGAGADFPDALAGSAASGGASPILLVTKDTIPEATWAELKRLRPDRIVVLGGTAAVSAAIVEYLDQDLPSDVSRLAGADRYSTAAGVSAAHFGPGTPVAFVARGENYPDALAGGPAAAKLGGPILLTQKGALPPATASELRRLKPKRIVVLGGTAAVSGAVEKALRAHTTGKVSRLAGADRYSTAAALSAAHFDPGSRWRLWPRARTSPTRWRVERL